MLIFYLLRIFIWIAEQHCESKVSQQKPKQKALKLCLPSAPCLLSKASLIQLHKQVKDCNEKFGVSWLTTRRGSLNQMCLMGPALTERLVNSRSLPEGHIQGDVHITAALSLPLPPLFGFYGCCHWHLDDIRWLRLSPRRAVPQFHWTKVHCATDCAIKIILNSLWLWIFHVRSHQPNQSLLF